MTRINIAAAKFNVNYIKYITNSIFQVLIINDLKDTKKFNIVSSTILVHIVMLHF